MTAKEMIKWYAEYKGYTLATNKKDAIQRRILGYLYIDLGQGIITRNTIQEIKAIKGLEEFKKLISEESLITSNGLGEFSACKTTFERRNHK